MTATAVIAAIVGLYVLARLFSAALLWHMVRCCRCTVRLAAAREQFHGKGRCQLRDSHLHHEEKL